MNYLMSILMGLIQGVAEFLPISSSGHLTLFQAFFGMENMEETHMFFTVLLHFGTLISVCIVYWRDIIDMIREFFLGIRALAVRDESVGKPPATRRMVMLIVVATLPLFVMVFFKNTLEQVFSNPILVSCMLLLTGFILFFSDRLARGHKTAKNATVTDALLVGCAQAVAIIPGISRSGATISAGMLRGFDRNFAVRFSFLMSLPAVVGATLLELKDAATAPDFAEQVVPLLPVYLVGVVVSAVVGYFAIRLVKSLADKGKFGSFAYYCWAVGAVSLIAGILKFVIFA
ncbi:undecaprenyl-diphosphate phosphatase [Pseudoflavonifractor capillosus]|uniref:Undecaprenyl-diphosphatase n=1 Tax=Pseudoflavonifractor capillosus TaxID=106588 RepID=A0A921MKA0_9FIRM|nr:undecaprenyl-diphosphate phosphatase [Pseudoflavonifractor capillosus]HJG86143.1 undecaprenyl-diphosphate phosphatase [Pseudoflavonifractor capillosus]